MDDDEQHHVMDLPQWLPELRQQLIGVLDPWVQVLATQARFSFDTNPSDPDAALTVELSTDGEVDVRVFEAIELLALIGGIDPQFFTVHVYAAAMRHSSWLRLPESTAVPIKCVLRIHHGDDLPTAITALCERLVLGGVEGTASKEYASMRALLEATYRMVDTVTQTGRRARVTRDVLVVRVDIQAAHGDFEERVAQLAQVAVAQHAREAMSSRVIRHHQWRPIFRVTEVDPGIPHAISIKAFWYLAQIVSCGIDLRCLWVYNMDMEAQTAPVFAQGLQLLARTSAHDFVSPFPCGYPKRIKLPLYTTEQTVSAVSSVLMLSRSMMTLEINHETRPWHQDVPSNRTMTSEERTHLWKWVALALLSRYASHQLTAIRLHVQDRNEDDMAAFRTAVLEFLQLVSRDVTSLYIVSSSTHEPLDDWLFGIAQACPHLESVTIVNGGSITSMDVFRRMYELETCQIKSLRLTRVRVAQPQSIPQFMNLLANGTLRIAKQLQQLSLTVQAVGTPLVNIVPIIDDVLTSNVKLQDLHMIVSYQSHIPTSIGKLFADASSLCRLHCNKLVAVRRAPLDWKQKFAFLTAMSSGRGDQDTHHHSEISAIDSSFVQVTRRLDHRVLSLIFEYAAACKKRSVDVRFTKGTNELAVGQVNEDEEQEGEGGGGADNDRED